MNPEDIKISVCIIARNEENFIADCLKSVSPIADEIVLVDTGSTDSTIEISQKFNCKIIETTWENDFSKARNISLDNASHDYILIIDADERLQNPELIKQVISLSPENIGGWLIEVTSLARRKDGSTDSYVSNLLRLFRKLQGVRFSGIIHEQIIEPIIQSGFKLESTNIKILHLGYSHNPELMRQKQLRNLELLDRALEFNSENGYDIFQKAKTLLALNRLEEAKEYAIKSIDFLNPDGSVLPQALNYCAIISFQLNRLDEAIARAKQ